MYKLKTIISDSYGFSVKVSLKNILPICGLFGSFLYATNMRTIQFEDYSLTSQTVSGPVAIGEPMRPLWILLSVPFEILMIAFGWGVWISAGSNCALRFAGGLLLVTYAVTVIAWPFSPMHLQGEETNISVSICKYLFKLYFKDENIYDTWRYRP